MRILGERLGIGIANVILALEPDVVAIGGGVSAAGELLVHHARETAERFFLRGVGTKTEIRVARYGPEAGVLGAALMAGQEMLARAGRAEVKVAVGFDHAGVPLRDAVLDTLRDAGHDAGRPRRRTTTTPTSRGRCARRCWPGRPSAACSCAVRAPASRSPRPRSSGIRAAVTHDTYTGAQCVSHDDCNVACLGARVVGSAYAADIVRAFAGAAFSGEERHQRRLDKVPEIERKGAP